MTEPWTKWFLHWCLFIVISMSHLTGAVTVMPPSTSPNAPLTVTFTKNTASYRVKWLYFFSYHKEGLYRKRRTNKSSILKWLLLEEGVLSTYFCLRLQKNRLEMSHLHFNWYPPGVDFANILRAGFCTKVFLKSFSLIVVWRCNFLGK